MTRRAPHKAWTDGIVQALTLAPDGLRTPELARRACPDDRPELQAQRVCYQALLKLERAGVVFRSGKSGTSGHVAIIWALGAGQ